MAHLCWTKFFWYKTLLLLSSTYWPFSKFKKILIADPELWGCAIFGPKMVDLAGPIFFLKIINIILIYLLAPFTVQNLKKKSSSGSTVTRMRNFWAQNSPFPKWEFFFQKTCWWALFLSFMAIYMQKIKVRYQSIGEILTIKDY